IVDRCDAMADALRAKQFDGFANFLRAADFASVHQLMQADFSGAIVDGAKFLGRDAELVAADSKSHDSFRVAALSRFDDVYRRVGADLARRVEYPPKSESAALEGLGGAEESFEICFGLLLTQEHYADGEGNFRVDDALCEQMFGEVAGDERVVLRLSQK